MKLLFDENISYRILKKLDKKFEGSIHCNSINPYLSTDSEIWNYARKNHYIIVTFDEDYYEWMLLKGFPPKIIWMRTGNSSTEEIANVINSKVAEIFDFELDDETGLLELY